MKDNKQGTETLYHQWQALLSRYQCPAKQADRLFEEIVQAHSEPHRFYHTLSHLESLFKELETIGCDDEACLWSVWYHDYVYQPGKGNNEAKSAKIAASGMRTVGVLDSIIDKVEDIINATKHHTSIDAVSDLFLDADMAILGADAVTYQQYVAAVKQEFKNIPAVLFNNGRKKFLTALLVQDELFLTDLFNEQYGEQAKSNIRGELGL